MKRIVAMFAAAALSLTLVPMSAHAESEEVTRTADWIADQSTDNVGQMADQVLALASTDGDEYSGRIGVLVNTLIEQAEEYSQESPEAAAKLSIVASATGQDPADFGGVDLTTLVAQSVRVDGSYGQYPGPFASGLAMVAMTRAGTDVPASMISYLLSAPFRQADGCFGVAEDEPSDADSTAMAIVGLRAIESPHTALAKAETCLAAMQESDGSFASASPVNSTGLAAPLLPEDASDKARDYVISQQIDDGALTTGDADTGDLMASTQGIFALTQQTYLSIDAEADLNATQAETHDDVADAGSGVALGLVLAGVAALSVGAVLILRRRPKA